MVSLDDFKPGAKVSGLAGQEAVTVTEVDWHGCSALTVSYVTEQGETGQEMVYDFDLGPYVIQRS